MSTKRSKQQPGTRAHEESSQIPSRVFGRETIPLVLSGLAICVSIFTFWYSTREQTRTQVVEYAQRKQEIRLELVRGWVLSVELESMIARHKPEAIPKSKANLDEMRRLAAKNSNLLREALANIDGIQPSPDRDSRIELETVAGSARIITEQGKTIYEQARRMLRKSDDPAQL